jgi:xylan 1,4-beta-xylosidase
MFGLMPTLQLPISNDKGFSAEDIITNGVHERADIHAMATRDANRVAVMVWNYFDDDIFTRPEIVELTARKYSKR